MLAKIFTCLLLTSGLLCSKLVLQSQALNDFETYLKEFNKNYSTPLELELRKEIFLKNLQFINKFNSNPRGSFKLGVNHLIDLTSDEWGQRISRSFPKDNIRSNNSEGAAVGSFRDLMANRAWTNEVPEAVDWTKVEGRVSGVQEQGSCVSGWAFSASGAVEGQMVPRMGHLIPLSSQYLVDCSFRNYGCLSGLMSSAWLDMKTFETLDGKGNVDAKSYPYTGIEGTCKDHLNNLNLRIAGYQTLKQNDEELLKQTVANFGPVSVLVDASQKSFMQYSSGVYFDENCANNPHLLNHGMLVVGYGKDPKSNMDFWLLKNSWGEKWGENGFMKLARNVNNQCGVATLAMIPTYY